MNINRIEMTVLHDFSNFTSHDRNKLCHVVVYRTRCIYIYNTLVKIVESFYSVSKTYTSSLIYILTEWAFLICMRSLRNKVLECFLPVNNTFTTLSDTTFNFILHCFSSRHKFLVILWSMFENIINDRECFFNHSILIITHTPIWILRSNPHLLTDFITYFLINNVSTNKKIVRIYCSVSHDNNIIWNIDFFLFWFLLFVSTTFYCISEQIMNLACSFIIIYTCIIKQSCNIIIDRFI